MPLLKSFGLIFRKMLPYRPRKSNHQIKLKSKKISREVEDIEQIKDSNSFSSEEEKEVECVEHVNYSEITYNSKK